MRKKILFVTNVDWFFISHRLVLAEEAIKRGYEVFVAASDTGRADEIREKGIEFFELALSRSGTNPITEFFTFLELFKIYKKIRPNVVHHITLKPVLYGSIIANLLKIKGVVNAISGLGFNFTNGRESFVRKVILCLMNFGFRNRSAVFIFQNINDLKELKSFGLLKQNQLIHIIKGSGVDLNKFHECSFPDFSRIIVLFPSRMLWDKGVRELREASNILKDRFFNRVQFVLAGLVDEGNKAGVSADYLNEWSDGNYVKWIGFQREMFEVYKNCHIVILPSYREGMPKSLLEACAVGRAIVTTDAIGCEETVDEGINGFKVPVYSVAELAHALELLIQNHDLIRKMGHNSRLKALNEFNVNNVVQKHIEIYSSFIQ